MKLRIVIVEDEQLASSRLLDFLKSESDVEVIGVCENGKDALQVVQTKSPNVVFLDVRIPELDGFEFLQAIPPASRPFVIFVTGDEKHARKAFDFHAVDFILKPFDRERFQLTIRRLRERVHGSQRIEIEDMVNELRQTLGPVRGLSDRIAIKNNGRVVFVPVAEINWVSAVGNYCEIHASNASHMFLSTLTALEERLPSGKFLRISRSAIINIDRLKEVRLQNDRCTAILADNTELAVGASHRRSLDRLMRK